MIGLIGGYGYVGQAFQKILDLSQLPYISPTRDELDATDKGAVAQFVQGIGATSVINAVGYVGYPNVDASEDNKLACLQSNVVVPGVLAEICADAGIPLGHVSTGCIFQGTRDDGLGFTESDPPNLTFRHPSCSFYSGTKALAEELLADYTDVYIWRLRYPFNAVDSQRNYLSKLMRYARLLEATNSISQLDEFCQAGVDCLTRNLPPGHYNLTNPGAITTREVVEMIERHGLADHPFEFFKDEAEFMTKVARVRRAACILDPSKAINNHLKLTEVHDAIDQALSNWTSENLESSVA